MTAEERARAAARAAEGKRGDDVLVLDVRHLTLVADYFVLATGETTIQIRALADAVEDALAGAGARPLSREGTPEARWILLDYGDVLVHLMAPEARAYYKLERLWADAPRLAL